MHILFISEQFPFPLNDGGNLRTYHILRCLAERHSVCLLTHEPEHPGSTDALTSACRVVTVPRTAKVRRVAANLFRFGPARIPLFVLKNRSQYLLNTAENLVRSENFDVVHFSHLDTACFALERHWSQRLVFDSHNCLSDMAERVQQASANRWRSNFVLAREAAALRRIETSVCSAVDSTLVCSDRDAKAFRGLCPDGRYEVVPNGVDTDYFYPGGTSEEQPNTLVFTGAMSYWPNEQGALHFCNDVMPILRALGVAVKVYFVGKNPSRRIRSLHDGATVIVTGAVDDVRPFVRRSQAVIVPLLHGGGTRLKILEAFAMGKAVISTAVGAEGIPATHGHEILIADDAQSFANQVARVITDSSLRNRIARTGLELARSKFDWQSIQQTLLDIYESRIPTSACSA
jgi:sugar transferase (PEP-CTERM/EpsH1 system associated)